MKHLTTAILLSLFVPVALLAQTKTLKKVLELKMPKETGDELCGTRGAAVAWHPVQKKYYASFAGNVGFPMGVFNDKGKRLSDAELTTQVDTRGLWYDAVTQKICGNGYGEAGWFAYVLDSKGIPTDYKTIKEGMFQPNDNSVGNYSNTRKAACFLDAGKVSFYKIRADYSDESVTLHWGRKKGDGGGDEENSYEEKEGYNTTTAIYTGIAKSEIGVLNINDHQIELYNEKDGYLQQVLRLPEEAPMNDRFNFAYANGVYWLFDIDNRTWIGYK